MEFFLTQSVIFTTFETGKHFVSLAGVMEINTFNYKQDKQVSVEAGGLGGDATLSCLPLSACVTTQTTQTTQ